MDPYAGDPAQRGEALVGALIDIVNRIAGLPLLKAVAMAFVLSLGLALIGLCLIALVVTLKVFQVGADYILVAPQGQQAPPTPRSFAMGGS